MKTNILLINPKKCDDRCPHLTFDDSCGMIIYYCKAGYFGRILADYKNLHRPQKCIEENGL